MEATVLTVAGLCMVAALVEQLLGKSRYFGAIRMVLGLQIGAELIRMICKLAHIFD